ncbi:hypothetical protein HDU97_006553 [Phlyctochytrium planicorne]|nr:hypothetical protein HDU97_006553 [Phlyctochytrium planicorne]
MTLASMKSTTAGPSPELKANFVSRILFVWMDGFLSKGSEAPLQLNDIYDIKREYEANILADRFEELWSEAVQEAEKKNHEASSAGDEANIIKVQKPNLFKVASRLFVGFLPTGLLKLLADIGNAVSPLLMQGIITFIANSAYADSRLSLGVGLAYAFAMFTLSVISSILLSNFFHRVGTYGLLLTGTLTAVIYRKAGKLSGMARQQFDQGKITNMISTDLRRIEYFVTNFHQIWTFSLQILFLLGLLIYTVGLAALAGFGFLLMMIPFNAIVIGKMFKLRKSNASITDKRVKLVTEALSSIRVLKFLAWENSFLNRIVDVRTKELVVVLASSILRSCVNAAGFAIPALAAALTFMVYYAIDPRLDPAKDLLLAEELDFQPETDVGNTNAITVENGSFHWDIIEHVKKDEPPKAAPQVNESSEVQAKDSASVKSHTTTSTSALASNMAPTDAVDDETDADQVKDVPEAAPAVKLALKDVNIKIPTGSLVAVVGAVGSGKTSFVAALTGGLKSDNASARVIFNGSVGYVPQQPWIMNATLRDNILFGLPLDQERYDRAVDVCALNKDLTVLPAGDMTEIGERGINLSGGQKQRVSLARLVYFDSSIVLLDDPLAAVDAHVGRHIFENCIKKELGKKTRVLVTHQLHFVPQCDLVITLKDGAIAEFGTYDELMSAKGEFATLMQSYGGIDLNDDKVDDADQDADEISAAGLKKEVKDANAGDAKGGKLIKAEDRQEGSIKSSTLNSLIVGMGGILFVILLVLSLSLSQFVRIINDLWLVSWTQRSIPGVSDMTYLWGYLGFAIAQSLLLFAYCAFVSVGALKAARHLHSDALTRLMRSPIVFFDTNPHGRILNRMTTDVDSVDNELADTVRFFTLTFGTCAATFALILYSTTGWFALALLPMMVIYYFIQNIYRKTARELKRLNAAAKSPVIALFAETFVGIPTIRAYNVFDRFVARTEHLIDVSNSCSYIQVTAQRWLGMRLECIGNVLVLATALFSVCGRDTISAALSGLCLAYALQVTQLLSQCVRQYTDMEVELVSVERLNYYAKYIKTEAAEIIDANRPPKEWPSSGEVVISNLSMRYQEHLPLVLDNVSLSVKPFEKIGVVGRTGAGKSSLMQALFRIVEAEDGSITIDSIPINTIGLRDLRSQLSIIPQDPVLFSGTVRTNLDPYENHADAEIWDALERSSMKDVVVGLEGGLEAEIKAGGENLSVGQRQLMCLARAMIRKPKLLILDECTASVDLETDSLIQESLRENMKNATIMTIAHRLNTVIDYDRILVLDQGRIAAFDSPANLLSPGHENQIFASLVDETGPANAAVLRGIAGKKL